MNNEDSKIILCFYIYNKFIKKMQVTKNSTIGCLLNFFNESNDEYILIFDGKIVDYRSTFIEINFINGKTIFAIRKNNYDESIDMNSNILSNIMKLSKDTIFEKKIRVLTNRNAQSEYNKIMDIRYMKEEGSRCLYKKKNHNYYLNESCENETQKEIGLTINYDPPSEPCEDAMPILW